MLDDIYFCEDCMCPEGMAFDENDELTFINGDKINEVYMIKLLLDKYNVENFKGLESRLKKSSDYNVKSFDFRSDCKNKAPKK